MTRAETQQSILQHLAAFEADKQNALQKRGFYICGEAGIGKTQFVIDLLEQAGYDVVVYTSCDVRNKDLVASLAQNHMSDKSVMAMFYGKRKPMAIVMDDVNHLDGGDKVGALVKLLRPKRTKKQANEACTSVPVFCTANLFVNKKLAELIKACHVYRLPPLLRDEMCRLAHTWAPATNSDVVSAWVDSCQGDLRQLRMRAELHCSCSAAATPGSVVRTTTHNHNLKELTTQLFQHRLQIKDHATVINETERNVVALLWHENCIDAMPSAPSSTAPTTNAALYRNMIDVFCFADKVDTVAFQKQVPVLGEMTSLLKTCYNNWLFHNATTTSATAAASVPFPPPASLRFTKVVAKKSSEHTNATFVHTIADKLQMDKTDTLAMFHKLQLAEKAAGNRGEKNKKPATAPAAAQVMTSGLYSQLDRLDITKTDVQHMFRHLERFSKVGSSGCKQDELVHDFGEECTDDAILAALQPPLHCTE